MSSFPHNPAVGLGPIVAFARRDGAITLSYRMPFVLDLVYGVMNLAVFFFISRTFEGSTTADLGPAPSYFAFAAVGLAVGLVVESAADAVGYKVRDEQVAGTFEALAAQPLTSLQLCLGLTGFPFLFALVRAVSYLLIAGAWLGVDVSQTSWVGIFTILVLSGGSIVALGILSGAVVLVFKRGHVIAATALFAMTMLSGSVFPISALPAWLEIVGRILPLRFAFDGARAAIFAGSGWGDDALVLALFTVAGVPAATWIFALALSVARRRGSIGQY